MDPEPETESSEESYRTMSGGSSARSQSQKTQYYDFQHTEETYPAASASELSLNQSKRAEEATYDSGNFSETVEAGFGHLTPSPAPPLVPLFSIGSPGLRRTSSGTEHNTLHRSLNSSPVISHSTPEVSASARSHQWSDNQVQINQEAMSHQGQRSDSYLHNLVGNFNTLYEQKLDEVFKKSMGGEGDREYNIVQKQNTIMKDWVRDLNEQNAVLIETVDDLEKEADDKIQALQIKIQRSTQMVMEHMEIIQNYEKQVQELVDQRTQSDREFEMLRSEAVAVDKKRKVIQDKLSSLEADHSSLITLMTRIRDWGLWDISGLNLNSRTHYHLFGLYPNLPGSEVQTVFTKERALQVLETERKLEELKLEYEKLQKESDEYIENLREKDAYISKLLIQTDELHQKIERLTTEKEEIKRKLDETQDILAQTVMTANSAPRIDLAAHDAEMTELLKELRCLKQDLNVACTERQNAMMEASSLKAEMSLRLMEMTQMKNLLVNIQAETENTRGKVQDVQNKQDQLSSIQDQEKAYQEKYEEARAMLNSKTDLIENLQQQMNQLQEKVSKIEEVKIPSPTPLPVHVPVVPPNIIHAPPIPPRRQPEEKALGKKAESLRVAAKNLDTASRAMKDLERQKQEDNSSDPIKSVHGSSFSGEKPPWNEYFYSTNTSNTFLKELEAFTAETTNAINYVVDRQHNEKNKALVSAIPDRQKEGKKIEKQSEKDQPGESGGVPRYEHATKLKPTVDEKQAFEKKKTVPLSVRYPKRSPRKPDPIPITDSDSPRIRSRSMDPKKKSEDPPKTSRRSQSKAVKSVEPRENKGILRKSDAGIAPARKPSKQSLRTARHEKITKYFSDRFGIKIEDPKYTKSYSNAPKVQESEATYVKERIKFAPYVSSKVSRDQQPRHKGNTEKKVEFNLSGISELREPKTSRNRSTYDKYQGSNTQRPMSRQAMMHEISSHSFDDDSCEEELDILPRITDSRPTTREEKLSTLPSGGLGYIPTTDPYELKKLEALVNAAVNTSRQLISSFDPSQGSVRMRVTASHRRHVKNTHTHHHKQSDRSFSTEQQFSLDEEDDVSSELPTNDTPQLDTSEEEPRKADTSPEAIQYLARRTEELAKPYSPNKPIPTFRPDEPPPRRQEDILASLPVQNHENVVKNWIMRNGFNQQREPEPQPTSTAESVGMTQKRHLHSFEARKSSLRRRVSQKNHRPPAEAVHSEKAVVNSIITPRDMFPKTKDVNLQKMNRGIDHWVSSKKEESSDTDSSLDKALLPAPGQGQGDSWCHNNNVRGISSTLQSKEEKSPATDELLQELNAKILSLESQCKSKDILIESLETELSVEKDYKKSIQKEMASKEAEVTMQKMSVTNSSASNLQNEMSASNLNSELEQKNKLLYQCFALLSKIEPDYLQENMTSGLDEYILPMPSGYKPLHCYTDIDIDRLITLLEGSKLEAIITTIIGENKELKKRLNEEVKKVEKLQIELDALTKAKKQPSALATQFHELISNLEGENKKFTAELSELADESESCKLSVTDGQSSWSTKQMKWDETFRVQCRQIANFEEYINRLHDEIRQWTNLNTTEPMVDSNSDDGSIIPILQKNIKHFEEFNMAKAEDHIKIMATMKKLRDELKLYRKRELELDRENKMMHQTIDSLNEKIAELVNSFEALQYHFGPCSTSVSRWDSMMDLSNISDNALMTSTPRVTVGVEIRDPANTIIGFASRAVSPDVPNLDQVNNNARSNTTDPKQSNTLCMTEDGGQGDNP